MAPIIILISVFAVLFIVDRVSLDGKMTTSFMGRGALAVMLLIVGIAHFTSADLMVAMMPEIFPWKLELVYFTGVCELLAVIGILWNKTARLTGVMLIIFYAAILPANISGAINQVPFGGMEYGAVYLFYRIPMQLLIGVWTWVFGVISVGEK